MPAINFSPDFAPLVEAGVKCQTIRQKARAKKGDLLTFYTGQRTKECRFLGYGVCKDVIGVELEPDRVSFEGGPAVRNMDTLDGWARMDGFTHYYAMWNWFWEKYGHWDSFKGFIIQWEPIADYGVRPLRVAYL